VEAVRKNIVHFNVPQFVDVEDKIAFQLTAKQLGWFALGGVALFFVWQVATPGFFFVWVFIIGALAIAFAFYKPFGIPFSLFLTTSVKYFVKPRVLVWERRVKKTEPEKPKREASTGKQVKIDRYMKEKELQAVDDLAKALDNQSKI